MAAGAGAFFPLLIAKHSICRRTRANAVFGVGHSRQRETRVTTRVRAKRPMAASPTTDTSN